MTHFKSLILMLIWNLEDSVYMLSLSELHWLSVCHRINFKIATITHRVLQFQQPFYFAILIPRYAPVQSLRFSSSLSICVPLRKTSMATSRSFSSIYGGGNSTTANEVSRFQCLFPNPNWLVWKGIPPPKTCSNTHGWITG